MRRWQAEFAGDMASVREIKCPTCKKVGGWFAGPFGPFCSKRCKLVDLGKWFSEENAITEPLRPEHFGRVELPPSDYLDEPEETR